MEIIREGNLIMRFKQKKLECPRCACIFKATANECDISYYEGAYYLTVRCPWCGSLFTTEEDELYG